MKLIIIVLALALTVSMSEAMQVEVWVTRYTKYECPNEHMASGRHPYVGAVAISWDLERNHGIKLGDHMVIDGKNYRVEDRTSRRLKRTVDIFTLTVRDALHWGRQKKEVEVCN